MKSTILKKTKIRLMICLLLFQPFAFDNNTNARQIKIWNDNDRL